jgi:hypothetical protein
MVKLPQCSSLPSSPSFSPCSFRWPLKVINDVESKTLAAASSKGLKLGAGQNMEAATAVGKALGDIAKVPTLFSFGVCFCSGGTACISFVGLKA